MRIALYDIDYTLLPFDSFNKLIGHFILHNPFNLLKLPSIAFFGLLTILKVYPLTKLKSKVVALSSHIGNEDLKDFSHNYIHKKLLPAVKPGVKEHIQNLKKQNFVIIFATASFEFYLEEFAKELGADHFFGTEVTISKGKRIIKGKNCKGIEKIKRITNKIPQETINKAESLGFSDSMVDYPFTKLVSQFTLVDKYKWKTKKVFLDEN